jgi:phospholipid/cholesterol/gamma-HCH transport system substrate-binding protein
VNKAIRDHWKDFAAIIGLFLISLAVGGYILSNQRFYLPHWVPVLGSDFVDYRAELQTAQSITPGQGQTVNVAGVPVGEISNVDLVNGRALVTMKIRRKFTPIYKDATILVRPKTGLNDMVLELSPGSRRAGTLDEKGIIPVSRTLPNVNLDEILASLDADTRDYLQLLLGGAGTALKGQSAQLAATLKRFQPTNRDLKKVTGLLAERHENVRRTIHNFSALSQALAGKDRDLAELVNSSNAVFRSFAAQDVRIREALRELPRTLQATNTGLGKADKLATAAGPALRDLRPGARALGPALRQTRPFLRKTTPVLRDQLRPFARDARPTVRLLRPAARDLAKVTPALTDSLKILNYALNELTYDKPGDGNQPYLFWFAWANRVGASVFDTQDAHGPVRRGLIVLSCASLETLDQLAKVNAQLGLLVKLLDPPRTSDVCPKTSQARDAAVARTPGGLSPLSPDAPTPIKTAATAAGEAR